MARALIVACGCRGRMLGGALGERGWQVRGTSRSRAGLTKIERVGIEPALADPDRVATVLDHVGDVTVVVWALASATGDPANAEAVNTHRLERALEKLVDTPVRGFVFERRGTVGADVLAEGATVVAETTGRWRIPTTLLDWEPGDAQGWARAGVVAVEEVLGA